MVQQCAQGRPQIGATARNGQGSKQLTRPVQTAVEQAALQRCCSAKARCSAPRRPSSCQSQRQAPVTKNQEGAERCCYSPEQPPPCPGKAAAEAAAAAECTRPTPPAADGTAVAGRTPATAAIRPGDLHTGQRTRAAAADDMQPTAQHMPRHTDVSVGTMTSTRPRPGRWSAVKHAAGSEVFGITRRRSAGGGGGSTTGCCIFRAAHQSRRHVTHRCVRCRVRRLRRCVRRRRWRLLWEWSLIDSRRLRRGERLLIISPVAISVIDLLRPLRAQKCRERS